MPQQAYYQLNGSGSALLSPGRRMRRHSPSQDSNMKPSANMIEDQSLASHSNSMGARAGHVKGSQSITKLKKGGESKMQAFTTQDQTNVQEYTK